TIVTADTAAAESKLGLFGRKVNDLGVSGSAALKNFSAIGVTAFAAVGAAAVAFGAQSVKAYEEHEAAVAALQNAIKHPPSLVGATTKAFEDQATHLQNLTGYQDEEVLKADAVLGRFKLTADQLSKVTPLVLDYARASGQDVPSAADAVGKALLG